MPAERTARDALNRTKQSSPTAALSATFHRDRTTLLFHPAAPRRSAGFSRRSARDFAKRLESQVTGGRPFTCLITGDSELRRLNREFRRKDYVTDVLSFPSAQTLGFLGDVAISFEQARRQAAEHGHAVGREIEILMLHGVLHLLGMDHEHDGGQMARAENKWRVRLGLPGGLIARSRSRPSALRPSASRPSTSRPPAARRA